MIFRPGDIVFRIARTREELEETYRLTNDIYRESGYIKECGEDIFPDKYSEHSTVFYGTNSKTGKIVAAMRSTEDVIGLPMEDAFDISDLRSELNSNGDRYVECGSRVTNPLRSPKANFGLLAIFNQFLVRDNITDVLVAMNEPDMSFYEKLGFRTIGEKDYYEKVHSWSYPMHIKVEETRQPYKDVLLRPHDSIILD